MKTRSCPIVIGLYVWAIALIGSGTAQTTVQISLPGPAGSGQFGTAVKALPNGNFVVTDPSYDEGGKADVGAAYLYNGASLTLISRVTGSAAGDRVGSGTVTVLPSGDYVLLSPDWTSGAAAKVGAVTWCSATTGCAGEVSATNSLVGSQVNDAIGIWSAVWLLPSGNYVVVSPDWANGGAAKAGAVTWCSGTAACTGVISAANSLVGSHAGDQVGYAVTAFGELSVLANGSYLVSSPFWAGNAGSVTLCGGTTGCTGVVSAANSLVGSQPNDYVGGGGAGDGVLMLPNSDYVASSPNWANGPAANAGAVTLCSGTTGCTGTVTPSNSLVGTQADDEVGMVVYLLTNGHYVVASRFWANGTAKEAGAVTWCNGTTGCTGPVSAANSLVGGTAADAVGWGLGRPLTNGNYVVMAPFWDNGAVANVGAVVWCDGTTGCRGPVTAASSLVGARAGDLVGRRGFLGEGVHALTNGNYVVSSGTWANGAAANAGAVTWCNGTTGCTGVVNTTNSLVGSKTNDFVGNFGVTPLSNGNFVVRSIEWDNGAITDAGAATWCSGTTGCTGVVSAANSLVGNANGASLAWYFLAVETLANGNYVVRNTCWKNGAATGAGAVTLCSGTAGCVGVATAANSLVGSQTNDRVGELLTILASGDYVVSSRSWANGGATEAGAATWCNGTTGCAGVVSAANSLVGSTAGDRVGGVAYGLAGGGYVMNNYVWSNGATATVGAVTWCSAATPCAGPVSAANSLVGGAAGDRVGGGEMIRALAQGDYVFRSSSWDNNGTVDAGAVTRGNGAAGSAVGLLTAQNSVRGTAASGGASLQVEYYAPTDRLMVGRPADNVVTVVFSAPAPTVTNVMPGVGPMGGGTVVTITGTGFVAGATVTIGGVAATNVTVVSATQISATTGAHAVGAVDVVVTNADAQAASAASAFTFVAGLAPAPTVTSVLPASGPTLGGTPVTIIGTNFVAGATVTLGGVAATGVTVASAAELTATTGAHAAGVVDVVVTNSDTQAGTSAGGFTYAASTSRKYYLAEGATVWTFDMTLAILNPSVAAAPVTVTFFKEDGTQVQTSLTMAAGSRDTLHVADVEGMSGVSFATMVDSTTGVPLVVERTMMWDGGHGAHGGTATETLSPTWYFAEGVQGAFDSFLLVANPGDVAADVTLTYLLDSGSPVVRTATIGPRTRGTFWAGSVPELGFRSFATTVTSTQPVVAERAVYFGAARRWDGGTAAMGVTALSTAWYFGEGASGPTFDLYLLLANPNPTAATATVTYLLPNRTTVERTYAVAAQARRTVWVNGEGLGLTQATGLAMQVQADQPILAERAMYWPAPYPAWRDGHASPGTPTTGTQWALAEGRIGGSDNCQTYLLLGNPGAAASEVQVTYVRAAGQASVVKTYTVPATSRLTVWVNGVSELSNETFGMVVGVLSGLPIVAERAMYWDAGGVWWAAGTAAMGIKLQ
jgi:hypothetical protein